MRAAHRQLCVYACILHPWAAVASPPAPGPGLCGRQPPRKRAPHVQAAGGVKACVMGSWLSIHHTVWQGGHTQARRSGNSPLLTPARHWLSSAQTSVFFAVKRVRLDPFTAEGPCQLDSHRLCFLPAHTEGRTGCSQDKNQTRSRGDPCRQGEVCARRRRRDSQGVTSGP